MTDLFCWILCDQPPGNFKTFPSRVQRKSVSQPAIRASCSQHVLANKSFQLAPKPFLISRIDYHPTVIWISQKHSTCPSGKLRTKITSPIAKSTSPGLSDTTFFARCPVFFIPKRLPIPTKLTFTPASITTTMMQNYSQRVICDMPGICLMFFLFAYSYTAFLMVDSFAASPIHSWDFCKKKKSFMKQVKPFIFPVTAWLLKSQNCSKHCLSVKHFTSRCKIYQLPNFKHAQKAKFQDSFWVLKWESSLDFHLSLSHLLSSFTLFLAPFFPFCWALILLRFISVERFLGKFLGL